MMKKHKTAPLTALLLLLMIALTAVSASALGTLPAANEQPRHETCTALSASAAAYYTGDYAYRNLATLSGAEDPSTGYTAMQHNALFSALHSLMADTHRYTTTYSGYGKSSLAYYWSSTDAVSSSDTYLMFYSDVMGNADGVKLNREHVWPKSRASYGTKNGGADLHHLRPSVDSVNSAKSNHTFGNVTAAFDTGYVSGGVNGETCYYLMKSADLFECKDDVKGDVARILLYVYCRWEQPNLYSDIPASQLPAEDSDSTGNSGVRVIESLDTLLQWCADDPVDTWEMRRNDLVESVQGNRNVFIDYPELAWQLFGEEAPRDMTTPSSGSRAYIGDANRDGTVDITDVTTIQRYLVSMRVTNFDPDLSDADGDGSVTILDATLIARYVAGSPCPDRIGQQLI